jgi:hypothetical protein
MATDPGGRYEIRGFHDLEKAEWNNSTIFKENIAEEISELRQQPGQNILISGAPISPTPSWNTTSSMSTGS